MAVADVVARELTLAHTSTEEEALEVETIKDHSVAKHVTCRSTVMNHSSSNTWSVLKLTSASNLAEGRSIL